MIENLVGRDTEIEREHWQIQNRWEREEGCNLPLLLMCLIFCSFICSFINMKGLIMYDSISRIPACSYNYYVISFRLHGGSDNLA